MKRTKKHNSILQSFLYSIDTDLELLGYDFAVWKIILFILGCIIAVPCIILLINVKIKTILYLCSFALMMVYPIINLTMNIRRSRYLCESTFIVLAAIICVLIKDYKAAVLLLFGYNILRLVDSYFIDKQRLKFGTIVDQIPDDALLIVDGNPVHKKPSRIKKGDYVGVNLNSVIPVDGVVINGSSSIDYSSITKGDNVVPIVKGSKVYSGGFNQTNPIIIQADCDYQDCFVSRILDSCQNSIENRPNGTVAAVYAFAVPILLIIILIVGLIAPIFNHQWAENGRICVFLLLLCCPYGIFNALNLTNYIAVLAYFSNGAIINKTNVVDEIGRAGTFICNKTGTLTENDFSIEDVNPEGISINNFLSLLLNIESVSQNPIARALRYYCGVVNSETPDNVSAEEIQGNGIDAFVDNNRILVGNSKFLFNNGIFTRTAEKPGSVVHAAINDKYCGYILFSNKLRKSTADSIEVIKSKGLKNLVLVSGDLQSYVRTIASSLGFNVVKAEVDKEEKASVTDYLMDNRAGNKTVVYLGNSLEEQYAASHADVSVSTDMAHNMGNIGVSDLDILSGGLSAFAEIYSVSVNKIIISRIITIAYIAIKALLFILVLSNVLSVSLFVSIMSFVMISTFIFICIRYGAEK